MKHKFGWDLPPGVTNRMIEEQAGAFEEKEEMSKEMEKLVEEIAQYIWGDHEDWEWACAEARHIITRIGKAVLSGECADLDKLLGVVGRGTLHFKNGTFTLNLRKATTHRENGSSLFGLRKIGPHLPFIAFREEEK